MADNVDPDPPPPPPEVVVAQPVTPIPPTAPPPHQGCMDKRSTLEKILLVIVIIILIICLGFIAAFLVFYFFASPPEGTCLSEQCVKSASRLKSYMDEKVDPCSNFYQYACGGWIKSKNLDPHESRIGVESTISNMNRIKIRGILERTIDAEEAEYKTSPKVFYKSCMNTDKLDERGAEPFLKLVETVGKFPALDDSWNETDFNLENVLIKLTTIFVMPLFTVNVARDHNNSAVNRIYISDVTVDSGTTQKYKSGRDDPQVRSYEKWLVNNLVLLGVNKSEAEQDMKDVVDLNIKIAKLRRSDEEKRDVRANYNLISIGMLQAKYPWFNWLKYFQGVVSAPSIGGVYILDGEPVINLEPAYLEKLGGVLSNTPKRVLANYMLTRLFGFTYTLGSKFIDVFNIYLKEVKGTEPKPRFEHCVDVVTSMFPESVSRMYVDDNFHKDAKSYMDQMIADLRASFSQILDEISWMTEETKKKAHEKLNHLDSKVGYPEYIMKDEELNKQHALIPVEEDKYFESIITHKQFQVADNVKSLREVRKKDRWPVHAAMVNSFYAAHTNEIIFPAGFLHDPVYSQDFSSSMNYGAIGAIIGHEITHGFDDRGRTFNANGELRDWWTAKDAEKFKSRTECFVDQYGCYKWDGHSLDGQKTLSENIADNGGLKQSFRVWCAKYRDDHKKDIVESEVHTPSPFRVHGTLQNSQEFADTFRCPQGSRMNPIRKCVLW